MQPCVRPGIPELGVRPIDPLCADEIHFSEASGKFRVNLRMTNVTMEGFRDYVVTGVRYGCRLEDGAPRCLNRLPA